MKRYGIESAVINLGGNAHVLGPKPDGSAWKVGIQDPNDTNGYLGGVSVRDKAIITSGGYERYFIDEATGVKYHHIIDPKTGYSANNGLISVTIVSADSTLADGLSTGMTPELIDEKVASMSCKAAVKGNNRLSAQEVDELIAELLTLDNPYHCPHGRPTIIAMTKHDLEKKFKRIV